MAIQSDTREHSNTTYKHLLNQRTMGTQEVIENANAVFHKTATMINHTHPFITVCLLLCALIRKHTEHVNTHEEFCKMEVVPNSKKCYFYVHNVLFD